MPKNRKNIFLSLHRADLKPLLWLFLVDIEPEFVIWK